MWHFKCSSLLLSGVALGLSRRGWPALRKERTVFTNFHPLEMEKPLAVSPPEAGDGCRAAAHQSPEKDLVSDLQNEVQERAQVWEAGRIVSMISLWPFSEVMWGPPEFSTCSYNFLLFPRATLHELYSCVLICHWLSEWRQQWSVYFVCTLAACFHLFQMVHSPPLQV